MTDHSLRLILQAKVAEIRELSAAVREKSGDVRAQTGQLQVVAAAMSQVPVGLANSK